MARLRLPRSLRVRRAHRQAPASMTLSRRMLRSLWTRARRKQADGYIVGDIVHFILPDALAPERRVGGLLMMRSAHLILRRIVHCNDGLTLDQRLDSHWSYALHRN